jgi:hypothetical protein
MLKSQLTWAGKFAAVVAAVPLRMFCQPPAVKVNVVLMAEV